MLTRCRGSTETVEVGACYLAQRLNLRKPESLRATKSLRPYVSHPSAPQNSSHAKSQKNSTSTFPSSWGSASLRSCTLFYKIGACANETTTNRATTAHLLQRGLEDL